jgi:4-amino-4-deoxy-L-arabinose transferase-like glycosyltransferase
MRATDPKARNTGLAILIAAITYPDWLPLWVRIGFVLLAISLIVWTWVPSRIRKEPMTFSAVLMIVSGAGLGCGLLLHFFAPTSLVSKQVNGGDTSPPPISVTNSPSSIVAPNQSGDTNTVINQALKPEVNLLHISDPTLNADGTFTTVGLIDIPNPYAGSLKLVATGANVISLNVTSPDQSPLILNSDSGSDWKSQEIPQPHGQYKMTILSKTPEQINLLYNFQ